MTQETKFLQALKDIFVGATIEGASGYINLMRIKARYFERGVFPQLLRDIDAAVAPFPGFREELFDKLYDFFHRYFSESGSIYFRYTPLHQQVYEKVYTDERDVALFYKTHMLYYVKTDRLFQSMDVVVDGLPFHFDVTGLEHKRANEKRALVFEFRGRRPDNVLVIGVGYSENGRKTKTDEMARAVQRTGVRVDEETLERAMRLFERQSEVDFFINKDARAFLREQFDLWLYQYVFEPEQRSQTLWSERRIRQVQALKDTAYRIIDFIAQFEDELVRIWNKPKFVRGSHYIITLERAAAQGEAGQALLTRFLAHPGMVAQVQEWRELGMLDAEQTLRVSENPQGLAPLDERTQFLPLDTRHFPDLEGDLTALFDHLDDALDGWLVKSDNYQALLTLSPKCQGRVDCVHIDPPYNTDTTGFLYANTYQHASWLTMMENRVSISLGMLSGEGSFLCHIDENEQERLHLLFEQSTIPNAGTIVWDKRNPMNAGRGIATQHEYVIWRSKQETPIYLRNESILAMLERAKEITQRYGGPTEDAKREYSAWVSGNTELTGGEKAYHFLDEMGSIYQSVSLRAPEPRTDPKFHLPLIHPLTKKPCPVPPNGFSRTPETLQTMMDSGEILFGEDETTQPRQKVLLTDEKRRQISSVIQDARKGKADLDLLGLDFPYCHPVSLYETLIGAATSAGGVVLDFFAGSGTTAHAVVKLNRLDGELGGRKYILVEMGEHFETVILPRIKKIAFSDQWRDGQAQPGGRGISHFVKYSSLEQYEDVLRRAVYADAEPLFVQADPYNQYVFLRDLKLLDNAETGEAVMTLDFEQDAVHVHLDRLYPDVDVAETLSCVTGQRIRRLTGDEVEFENGEHMRLSDPPWEAVKPLIWW